MSKKSKLAIGVMGQVKIDKMPMPSSVNMERS